MANNSVWQYEQPRCPDGWNEQERRFYSRVIQVFDDIFAKYGRIDEKMLAPKTGETIVTKTVVEMSEKMSATTIATDKLAAAFVNAINVSARYGHFDFETVQNLVAEALVLREAAAGKVAIDNLAAGKAQIVEAYVGNLCIKGADGKFYTVSVNADGTLESVVVEPTEAEIEQGYTEAGQTIVESSVTTEDLNASNIKATYALVGKILASQINADYLVAREAFVSALVTSRIFADGGTLQMVAESTRETGEEVVSLGAMLEQTSESFELALSKKVGEDTLKQYLRYEDGTVEMGSSDSRYKLQASNTGVVILQDGTPMTRMEQNTVAAPVFEAGRMLKIGNHTAKVSASGALIFN